LLGGRVCTTCLGLLSCWLLAGGCNHLTKIGSDCTTENCVEPPSCSQAQQQLPETCEPETRVCNGATIPADELACDACKASNTKLNIPNTPFVACACAHCAAQLAACFQSADLEDGGDPDRDTLCQAIVQCGWAKGCIGSECYCGAGVDRVTCLQDAQAGHPRGPCAGTIAVGSGCDKTDNVADCVLKQQFTPGSLLARTTAVAQCLTGDPLVPDKKLEPQCRADVYIP
jgi:hypothetical protein